MFLLSIQWIGTKIFLYLAQITNISISRLATASFVGLLPTQALNSYIGSTLRTINDVVHQDKSKGYAVVFIQVLISLCLMWYVIKRARYELNKECFQESKNTITRKPKLSYSKSMLMNGYNHSNSVYELSDSLPLDFLEDKHDIKVGHKRAKSASAILIDISSSWPSFKIHLELLY